MANGLFCLFVAVTCIVGFFWVKVRRQRKAVATHAVR
jgi:hypothetical protein